MKHILPADWVAERDREMKSENGNVVSIIVTTLRTLIARIGE